MINEWIFRIGDGINFINSSKYKIWGINEKYSKKFLDNVNVGDHLWFILNNKDSKIIAVATYLSHNNRILDGELINFSYTNKELGWNEEANKFNIEIHYINLYDLSEYNLLTYLRGPFTVRKFNIYTCIINLENEYQYIHKYCKIINKIKNHFYN